MKLLFVDDEIDVLRAIVCSISPQELGIDQILTATSAEEAKRIIQSTTVDILITDIEMPEESGIDLLRWVDSQNYPIVTMFCTCYSSFDYAQKAVELHAFDYYLKPISIEDFTQHLSKAINEARRKKKERLLVPRKKQSFWEAVLILKDKSLLSVEKLNEHGYAPTTQCLVTVTYLLPEQVSLVNYYKMRWLDWYHTNHVDCISIPSEFVYEISDNIICAVHQVDALSESTISAMLNAHAADLQSQDCPTCTYYSTADLDNRIADTFLHIQRFAQDDISRKYVVQRVQCEYCRPASITNPQMSALKAYLVNAGSPDDSGTIHSLIVKAAFDYKSLKDFKRNAYHMGMVILDECGVNAQEILSDPKLDMLEKYAAQSILYAQEYVLNMKAAIGEALAKQASSENPVSIVQRYIELHLDENLSRSTLAELVHLNPDYFARLFCKQAGTSLGAFILNKRIEKAMVLLRGTNKSITEIAGLVGYDNSSYFTQTFQHKTGITPMDYRNTKFKAPLA